MPYMTTVTVGDGTICPVDTVTWQLNSSGVVGIMTPGPQSSTEEGVGTLPFLTRDSRGGTLYYKASGLPSGLNVKPDTSLVFGTGGTGATSRSKYSVRD
jgi:hypothetical protein